MTGMMRGGRFNSQCKCCNDDVCDGFRTREKNEWKKDMADEIAGQDAHLVVFDELDYQDMTPLKIYLGEEAWNKLMDALDSPPAPSENLKKLMRDNK